MGHAQIQLAVGEVATWINDGAGVVIHDEELVGLNCLTPLRAHVRKHQADMAAVAIQFVGHWGPGYSYCKRGEG